MHFLVVNQIRCQRLGWKWEFYLQCVEYEKYHCFYGYWKKLFVFVRKIEYDKQLVCMVNTVIIGSEFLGLSVDFMILLKLFPKYNYFLFIYFLF